MMFHQQVNFGEMNQAINQEFMKICNAHPSCDGCPLKNEDMEIQGSKIRCETGRRKGCN